jgi:DNA gyrase inhibitor GyrI
MDSSHPHRPSREESSMMGSEYAYLQVRTADLSDVIAVCREFLGHYERSPEYVAEVQRYLQELGISDPHARVLTIYLDDPAETDPAELRSYQGVILDDRVEVQEPYFVHQLKGLYLYVTIRADEPDQLPAAYGALFGFAGAHGISIASDVGVLIMRRVSDATLTDVCLQIDSGA